MFITRRAWLYKVRVNAERGAEWVSRGRPGAFPPYLIKPMLRSFCTSFFIFSMSRGWNLLCACFIGFASSRIFSSWTATYLFPGISAKRNANTSRNSWRGWVYYITSSGARWALMNIGRGSSSVPKWICFTSSSVGGAWRNRGLLSFWRCTS